MTFARRPRFDPRPRPLQPILSLLVALVLGSTFALAQNVALSPPHALFTDSITVQLSGGNPSQQIRYVVASGPGAVAAEVTRDSPVYSGPITLTATSLVRAAVFNADGSATGRTTSGYYLRADASVAGFDSQLPVLVVDDLGAGELVKDDIDHPSWLLGFTPGNGPTFSRPPAFASPLEASVRGTSSAFFPKRGYNVRMRDAAGRSDEVALFDLPAYDRWALVAPWSFDPNFFNNAFVYELSNRIGRWAPRTRIVELFFNTAGDDLGASDYAGIYVITDRIRIEPGRVDIEELSDDDNAPPAITGGYVFKIDERDPDELGWKTTRGVPEGDGGTEIVLVEPDADDVTAPQLRYLQDYVQEMENALHADRASGWAQRTYLEYLDRASWVDHHLLNVLVSNPDGLHRSAYFTKPRGGRLQAGPVWDFDRALGGFWDDRTQVVNTWSGVGGAVDFWQTNWWGVLADDPEFVQQWIDRWQSLRRNELSTASLTALAQSFADAIGVEAANRDVARWPDSVSVHGSYPAQIAYLKNWLAERAAWIDSQFVAAPAISTAGATVIVTPPDGTLLAYTTDGSDPRAIGGAVSPRAQIHAGPLTLPPGENIRARSYDPTPRAQFPASAWSMAVDSFRSAAATDSGRIVNLSSRATVGAGDDALIVGFVVADAPAKRYLLRAVGPGLAAFGVTNALATPQLIVSTAQGAELLRGQAWQAGPDAAQLPALAQSVGAFALTPGSADAALVASLPAANYTLHITGGSGSGVALAELYELDRTGRTANVSIRGRARSDDPLIGGFVLAGPGDNRLLIRAAGPTLRAFGLDEAAADPRLILRAGASIVAANDGWSAGPDASTLEQASQRVGAFAFEPGSQDAAVLVTLAPGSYTVEIDVGEDGDGVALLEIYDIP